MSLKATFSQPYSTTIVKDSLDNISNSSLRMASKAINLATTNFKYNMNFEYYVDNE